MPSAPNAGCARVRAAFEAQMTAEVAARDAIEAATINGARHELSVDEVTRLDAAIATLAAPHDRDRAMNSFRSAVGSVEYAHARLCARYGQAARRDRLAPHRACARIAGHARRRACIAAIVPLDMQAIGPTFTAA